MRITINGKELGRCTADETAEAAHFLLLELPEELFRRTVESAAKAADIDLEG